MPRRAIAAADWPTAARPSSSAFRPGARSRRTTRRAGFVTGFYEPEVEASPVSAPNASRVPLLAVPPIWSMSTTPTARRASIPILPSARGRRTASSNISTAADRAAARWPGEGWRSPGLPNKVDAFFIHVQGAARLLMPDGRYAASPMRPRSGQRFTGSGQDPGRTRRDSARTR